MVIVNKQYEFIASGFEGMDGSSAWNNNVITDRYCLATHYLIEIREPPYPVPLAYKLVSNEWVIVNQELIDEFLIKEFKKTVPTQITPRQIRQQLTAIGLRQTVEDLISSSTDYNLKDWWEYSQDFQRSHPILKEMGEKLGMSETDMDNFFIEASKL